MRPSAALAHLSAAARRHPRRVHRIAIAAIALVAAAIAWAFAATVLDGGRTIRGGTETFAIDPSRPVRLVLRTGGARATAGRRRSRRPGERAPPCGPSIA